MTEPKYKIGQWVKFQGRIGQVAKSDIEDFPIYIVISDNSKWHLHDWGGVEPVVIYPDYGEAFCKDCEGTDEGGYRVDHSDYIEPRINAKCVIDRWVSRWYASNGLDVDIVIDDDMQPPPKCHCFKPRAK